MATVPDLVPSARPATALILLGTGITVVALAGMAPQDMALALGGAVLCCVISLARKRLGSSSAN